MAVDANYYARLLESFYDSLSALDVTGYASTLADGTFSDGWTQARLPFGWTAHLEAWVDLGTVSLAEKSRWLHNAALHFACRYNSDDDSISQARMQAATRDAMEFLLGWSHPTGERVLQIGSTSVTFDGETGWLTVKIPFSLHIPRK